MAKKIVVKFGGSNLKRKEDTAALIKVLELYGQPVVIVVSALYGVTDTLVKAMKAVTGNEETIAEYIAELIGIHQQVVDLYIHTESHRIEVLQALTRRVEELEKFLRGIHCIGEAPDFVEDRVLSYGERLSSLVLTSILKERQIPCTECLPESLGLFTNGEFRNATVDFARSEKIVRAALAEDITYIIPGFYGISHDAKVTLLGRGGSDYTAAAIARCIDAASVDLWKDVQGFMSADPKLVYRPEVIDQLSYNEAAELSYFGARIAHPRTFEPLAEKKIPVRLFNITAVTDPLKPVTVISEVCEITDKVVKSVTFSDDFGVLKLHGAGVGIKPGILARTALKLTEAGINIKSVVTSQTCIKILLSLEDLRRGLLLTESLGLTAVDRITVQDEISLIAVVGEGLLERPGIAARVLSSISAHGINVLTISAGASNTAIYFIIAKSSRKQAIQAIHDEFFGYRAADVPNQYAYRYDHCPADSLDYVI